MNAPQNPLYIPAHGMVGPCRISRPHTGQWVRLENGGVTIFAFPAPRDATKRPARPSRQGTRAMYTDCGEGL